ncbi:MAG: AprI/Inh family metalloprotease inhibitor [Pseudomonadota bacterium]
MTQRLVPLVAALLCLAGSAQAQSSQTTRSTTTTTTSPDGRTTTTVTKSTSVGTSVSVDEEKLGAALAGALIDRMDPEEARLRRLAEPARTQDAFGSWRVRDGGRDAQDCRFEMGEKAGFLGVRPATATACPRRLANLAKWRVQTGELVFYSAAGQELKRLRYVEGRFIGGGVEMVRD